MMNEFEPQSVDLGEQLRSLESLDQPLSKQGLTAFSNLDSEQVLLFQSVWKTLASERRSEIIKTLQTLAEDNVDLDFRTVFLSCLDDPDDTVRAIAVEGLWEDEQPWTMRRLLGLLHDPSSQVRIAALLNLARFAYRAELGELSPEAAQTISAALLSVSDDPQQPLEVQWRAIEGLGYFARLPEAREHIVRAYHQSSRGMRESAVVAMGRSMLPDWFGYIQRELQSSLPSLRYIAAQAAGELGEEGQSLVPTLLPLVEDDDQEVSLAAIGALGQVGGTDAERVLKRLARSRDEARRQAARDALDELSLSNI